MSEKYKRYFLDLTEWEVYRSSEQHQECMVRFGKSKEREIAEVIELKALTDAVALLKDAKFEIACQENCYKGKNFNMCGSCNLVKSIDAFLKGIEGE